MPPVPREADAGEALPFLCGLGHEVHGPEGLSPRHAHATGFVSTQLSLGIHSQPGVHPPSVVQTEGGGAGVAGGSVGIGVTGTIGGRVATGSGINAGVG